MLIERDSSGKVTAVEVRHFDPHVHFRKPPQKDILVREASQRMCGGIEEPNTNPHPLTCDDVERELDETREIAPYGEWSASIYLTPNTLFGEVRKAWERRLIGHVKGYPPHGSTHSAESVPPEMLLDINSSVGRLLCAMAEAKIPFKNHGEIVIWQGKQVHPQRREGFWYQEFQGRFDELYRPRGLRHIHAHITTSEAVRYMEENGDPYYCVCEVTGHHLAHDWNIQYDGGFLMPDHHWLPVSKDEGNTRDLRRLVKQMPKYVLAASDMAGHNCTNKYAQRALGGAYTYHCSLELYVQILERLGVLNYADDFLYGNARRFHKDLVPGNPKPFRLVKENWTVDSRVLYEGGEMTPFGYDKNPEKRFAFQYKLAA